MELAMCPKGLAARLPLEHREAAQLGKGLFQVPARRPTPAPKAGRFKHLLQSLSVVKTRN